MKHPRLPATLLAGLSSLAFASLSTTARAEVATGACAAVMDPNNAPSTDPRVDHLVVGGVHVNVVVPPRYRVSDHRYPVLYLFHGAFSDEDSFTTQTDVLSFTAQLDDDHQAILVTPDGSRLPAGRDWVDGTHPQETFVIGTLLQWVDANYRTLADRAYRAAAGFSAGGMNAMVFAARHPDLFVAAASFSGFVDPYSPSGQSVVQLFTGYDDQLCGGTEAWTDLWGDPVLHPMGWLGHDPVNLVPSLQGLSLYMTSANGTPCPDMTSPDPFLEYAESVVDGMTHSLDQAMTAAQVRHDADYASCGIHLFSNSNAGLRAFWPRMLHAFGSNPAGAFDYRTGDASASVYGWAFAADPARAPEFLDVRGASAGGVTLTGSGSTTVTTAPFFHPGDWISVEGTGACSVAARADASGRISFTVDLGAAHTLEQGTTAQVAAASADPGYFVTRSVSFRRSFN
jgi:S-formylglutathione hydrolase FrmB